MRKLVLVVILLASTFALKAQYYWDYGGGLGVANILGDMGGKQLSRRDFVSDIKFQETRQSANGFARYKLSPMFSVKANLSYVCLRGADSLCTYAPRHYRNLSFRNYCWELSAEAQWYFYEVNDLGHTYRYKDNFRAYIGLGVGAMYHNPKALYNGEWIPLRPLETENYHYTKITMTIPATIGFYFTINKHYRIGWNLDWRTTFTDYLDDVSGSYADPAVLATRGPNAVALSDRSNHALADAYGLSQGLGTGWGENFGYGSYMVDGKQHFNMRGENIHNDSFITSNVEFSYVFRGKSSLYRSHYSSIFKGKKYKHRKVRAKF